MNKIEIPKELSERSKRGILQAKQESQKGRKRVNVIGLGIAAALLVSLGSFTILNNDFALKENRTIVKEENGVKIPAIQLPKGNVAAKMMGLIVYNGEIYTQARTQIDAEKAKALIGEKLGTTKGNINEWSKQKDYDEELASTIGIEEVYTVKGYDKDFRIMTYGELDGNPYAEFYENLNGITINNGDDVFGKLKMAGNVSTATYRTFDDWNNGVDNYRSITDQKVLNDFIEELNHSKPFTREGDSDPMSQSRNNEEYRELTIQLEDGTKVSLDLFKEGYIYYGDLGAYFKMNEDLFSKMWSQLP